MVEVTERAREELKKALDAQSAGPASGLRLALIGPGEFGLGIDKEQPGDQVVQHEGANVLLVEGALAEQLEGASIDIQESEEGPRLVMSMTQ